MKKLLTAFAIAPLFLAQPALAEVGPWYGHSSYYEQHRLDDIEARHVRQREAFERGVARGSYTPEEHVRLQKMLVHIVVVKRNYRSDGHFTADERATVSRLQDMLAQDLREAGSDRHRRRYY